MTQRPENHSTKHRTKALIAGLVLASTGLLAACGGAAGAPAAGAPAAPQQAQKQAPTQSAAASPAAKSVTIQIDGAAVPYYAPLYVAAQKGFFAHQGLKVKFLYANAATIIKNVAAGNVQFGFPNADSVIVAYAHGLPVKVVHTTYQHGIDALIFNQSAGIHSPADLKGKTIAVTSYGSPDYIDLQVMLKAAHLTLKDVHLKIVGTGAIVGALQSGKVDAIMFSMIRYYALKAAGVKVGEIPADKYVPSHGNVLIVGNRFLKQDPAEIRSFIRGLDQGIAWVDQGNAAAAVKLSTDSYAPSFKGQEKIVTGILQKVFVPYLWQSAATKQHGLGWGSIAGWQKTIDTLHGYKAIPKSFPAKDLVVEPSAV